MIEARRQPGLSVDQESVFPYLQSSDADAGCQFIDSVARLFNPRMQAVPKRMLRVP